MHWIASSLPALINWSSLFYNGKKGHRGSMRTRSSAYVTSNMRVEGQIRVRSTCKIFSCSLLPWTNQRGIFATCDKKSFKCLIRSWFVKCVNVTPANELDSSVTVPMSATILIDNRYRKTCTEKPSGSHKTTMTLLSIFWTRVAAWTTNRSSQLQECTFNGWE